MYKGKDGEIYGTEEEHAIIQEIVDWCANEISRQIVETLPSLIKEARLKHLIKMSNMPQKTDIQRIADKLDCIIELLSQNKGTGGPPMTEPKPFIGIRIPEDCKAIYICVDKDQMEHWLDNSSMKPLLNDSPSTPGFMPVYIAYRPVTPDQTYLEALGAGPVDL